MRLGNVVDINPESIRSEYLYDKIEYIDISSVGTGFLRGTTCLTLAEAPSRAKRIVKNGDTLLATVRPNLRSFLFVKNPQVNTIASTGFAVMRGGQKIDARFLYYTVTNQSFTDYLTANAKGAAYPAVDTETIQRADIYLPPLPVQHKIAAILSAYDDLIENNLRRIKILEQMAQGLYREWFVKFRFPGHEQVRMVDSFLGRIPEGWEGYFGDLVIIQRDGINPSQLPDEEFEHFSIPAFDESQNAIVERGENIRSGKYLINGPCILLSKLNPRIPRVWLPYPSGPRRAVTSTEFLVLKPRVGITREFVYAKCLSQEFVSQFSGFALGTSTSHQRVKPNDLITMPTIVPDRLTIEMYSNFICPMIELSQQLRRKIRNLRHTRDLLLPKLISGELDVSELDINVGLPS